ncbi:MAG: hypothetical protein WC738_02370 [Candidatus Omnitrophota bacterium]|jgi:hypothetical protein
MPDMKAEMNSSKLAFVEVADDVVDIFNGIAAHGIGADEITWIAMEIDAEIMLRGLGIKPILPVELLSNEERKEIFLEAADWAMKWLDDLKADTARFVFKRDASLAETVKDGIYRYFNYVFYAISVMHNSVNMFKPALIIVPSGRPEDVVELEHSKEYNIRHLGRAIGARYSVKVLEIGKADNAAGLRLPAACKDGLWQTFKNRYGNLVFKLFANDRVFKGAELSAETRGKLSGMSILILGGGAKSPSWRLKPLVEWLRDSAGCRCYPLLYLSEQSGDGISLFKISEKIRVTDAFTNLVRDAEKLAEGALLQDKRYKDINITYLCNSKLRWILRRYLPDYWLGYLSIKEMQEEYGFDLLMGGSHATNEASHTAALHFFANERIPSLLIPHGVQFCIYPEKGEIDKATDIFYSNSYSHFAVVGEGIKNNMTGSGLSAKDVAVTGNIEYDKRRDMGFLRKRVLKGALGLSARKKTIVYFLARLTRDFHMEYLYTNFDETERSVIDVLNVSERLNCDLIIKPHPAFTKAAAWINRFAGNGKYRIINAVAANPALLSFADIVITSRSSIAVEAIDYERPVMIFEHDKQDLAPFEDEALTPAGYRRDGRYPFVRATGFAELYDSCKKILGDDGFNSLIKENCRTADPWVYHNRDGMQFNRIAGFIADITG